MTSEYLFLCYSDFNTGMCISVPYEVNENTDYFVLAQHLYNRINGQLYFHEILRNIEDPEIGKNLYTDPFGCDGSFCTFYIERNYDAIRNKWFPIRIKDQTYIPVPYLKIDGVIIYSIVNPMSEDLVRGDGINHIQYNLYRKHVSKIGLLNYNESNAFDYDKCKNDLLSLFDSHNEFTYEGINVIHGLKFETIEDLRANIHLDNFL